MKLRQLSGVIFVMLVIIMIVYLVTKNNFEGFVDPGRCGVYLPPCQGENIRCINGYCKSDIAPKLPLLSDLPMTPPTKYPYA